MRKRLAPLVRVENEPGLDRARRAERVDPGPADEVAPIGEVLARDERREAVADASRDPRIEQRDLADPLGVQIVLERAADEAYLRRDRRDGRRVVRDRT